MTKDEILSNWVGTQTVYKYRPFKKQWHFDALSKREIFYSTFEKNRQDDPQESKDPFQFEMPNIHQLTALLRRLLKKQKPELNSNQRRARAELLARNSPLIKDPNQLQVQINQEHEARIKTAGIFCSSYNPNSEFCWSKFAENSTGFVIGYNIETFFNSANINFQPVYYYEHAPKISWQTILEASSDYNHFENNFGHQVMISKYCSKPIEFKREEEWRWLKFNLQSEAERKFIVEEQHIKSVVIGKNMSQSDRIRLHQLAEEGGIHPSKISIQK